MLKMPKPSSVPEMPEIMPSPQFKPLRPQIKTIVADNHFDERVNTELKMGWRVREIKIIPIGNTVVTVYYFAILERLVEVDES